MLLLKNKIFRLLAGLYIFNRFIFSCAGIPAIPYLNDVACLPVVLTVALVMQIKLGFKSQTGNLSLAQIIFVLLLVSVVFEGILPVLSKIYRRDFWDILAYAAGGVIYYYGLNPENPVFVARKDKSDSVNLKG